MSSNETGKAIQRLREARGLTQDALAERLGVSQQSVAKWESGLALPRSRAIPDLERELSSPQGYLVTLRAQEKGSISPAPALSQGGNTTGIIGNAHSEKFDSFQPQAPNMRPGEYAQAIRQSVAALLPEELAEWDTKVRGSTLSWSVDYQNSLHVAQFVTIGSGIAQRMAYFNAIPNKLWHLATLRAHLRDDRLYILLITVPSKQGFERNNVHDLFRKFIAEAALMEIFVFVVDTPEQAAAILNSKFRPDAQGETNHEDGDDEADVL